jgi:hypothetical protein
MSQHRTDTEIIAKTRNTSRFFVETRRISWVLLIATCIWGIYGYTNMPQRKDPEVQVRTAVALTPWRGASAEKVEQLITKKIETQMAANAKVTKIKSISRTGLSVVYLDLDENLKETGKELDDIKLKLDGIHDLPSGAGPINFIKDFADTAALMLTVASPKASDVEIDLRAKAIQSAIEQARSQSEFVVPPSGGSDLRQTARHPRRIPPEGGTANRVSLIVCLPQALVGGNLQPMRNHCDLFVEFLEKRNLIGAARPLEGAGFIGVDAAASVDGEDAQDASHRFQGEPQRSAG